MVPSATPVPASPFGITAGPDGNIWFAAAYGIGKITPSGAITWYLIPTISGAFDIAAGPDGNLRFTDGNNIGRITTG